MAQGMRRCLSHTLHPHEDYYSPHSPPKRKPSPVKFFKTTPFGVFIEVTLLLRRTANNY